MDSILIAAKALLIGVASGYAAADKAIKEIDLANDVTRENAALSLALDATRMMAHRLYVLTCNLMRRRGLLGELHELQEEIMRAMDYSQPTVREADGALTTHAYHLLTDGKHLTEEVEA